MHHKLGYKRKTWDQKDIDFLIENYKKYKISEIAKILNRTKDAVQCKAAKLGLEKISEIYIKYEELEFIKNNYSSMSTKQISQELGRSMSSINFHASELGVKKYDRLDIGSKFNRLTILSFEKWPGSYDRNHGHYGYLCLCECGNTLMVRRANLIGGNVGSCGCLSKETRIALNDKNYKSPGHASFVKLLAQYKIGAEKRGLNFNLTLDDFIVISTGICVYCGSDPRPFNPYLNKRALRQDTIDRAWINFNGIDRVDSSIGYELSNCVTCCSTCNRMKWDHPKDFFIEHIYKIISYQRENNES